MAPQVIFEGELGRNTYQWTGRLVRSEGAFDPATRMLYLVAQIDNPFTASAQRPAIRVGQFLRAKIEGEHLTNVFVIPRRAVSQDNYVAVAQEGVLQKQKIEPLWTDHQFVVVPAMPSLDAPEAGNPLASVSGGLRLGQRLILTPAANLPNGTRIKPMASLGNEGRTARAKPKREDKANSRPATDTAASSKNH
jgi:multidrug efflux pump subunit AcrA (membrane-fusion protein)